MIDALKTEFPAYIVVQDFTILTEEKKVKWWSAQKKQIPRTA